MIYVYFINDNRQREILIPIIKDHVYIWYDNLNQNKDNNENYYATNLFWFVFYISNKIF